MTHFESDSRPYWLYPCHVSVKQLVVLIAIVLGLMLCINPAIGQPSDSAHTRTDSIYRYVSSTTRFGIVYSLHLLDVAELNKRITAVGFAALPFYATGAGNFGFECGYNGLHDFGIGISYHQLSTDSYTPFSQGVRATRFSGQQIRIEGSYTLLRTGRLVVISLYPMAGFGISQIDFSGRDLGVADGFDLSQAFVGDSSFALHKTTMQLHIGFGADLNILQYDSSGWNPLLGVRASASIPLADGKWYLNGAIVEGGPAVRTPSLSFSAFIGFNLW